VQRTQSCVFGFNRKSPIFNLKAGYVRCATCVITRGVSYIRVFRWAFGDASIKTWIFRHATFSFCAGRGGAMRGEGAKTGKGKKMKMVFNHGIHRIHGMIISLVLLFGVAVSAVAAEPGITVEARQRYPWNGLVDLKFTITGESGTKYDTSFVAKDMVGGTNIAMKTIRKSNGVAAEEKEKLLPGTYNWVWDAAADLPKDFKCDRMTVIGTADVSAFPYTVKFNANGGTGTMANQSFTYGTAKALTANAFTRTGYVFQGWATSASGGKVYNDKQKVQDLTTTSGAVVNLYAVWKAALYMVIDLSTGAKSYLADVPEGGWTVAHKTKLMVLRKINKGTNKAGGSMAKNMWVGIFEFTQGQAKTLGTGCKHEVKLSTQLGGVGDCKPINYKATYGTGAYWLEQYSVCSGGCCFNMETQKATDDKGSYITSGDYYSTIRVPHMLTRFKTVTGLSKTRLPSIPEWQYAYRAGTTTEYYSSPVSEIATYAAAELSDVGSHKPNAWGLYDMSGNVGELTSGYWSGTYASWQISCGGTYRVQESGCKVTSTGWADYCLHLSDSSHYCFNAFRIFVEE